MRLAILITALLLPAAALADRYIPGPPIGATAGISMNRTGVELRRQHAERQAAYHRSRGTTIIIANDSTIILPERADRVRPTRTIRTTRTAVPTVTARAPAPGTRIERPAAPPIRMLRTDESRGRTLSGQSFVIVLSR